MEVKFEQLPEMPQKWLDFLNLKLPFSPAIYEMSGLPERANALHQRMAKNETFRALRDVIVSDLDPPPDTIQRLLQPGSVVVTTHLQASLLGGPISQILKCLTASRVCEELKKYGIAAVPVAWLDEASPPFPIGSIQLLDKESELHCLQLPHHQIETLLLQIEALGQGVFDLEALDRIRSAFVSAPTLSSAAAKILAALMKELGIIVLDAAAPSVQSILNQARATIRQQTETVDSPLALQSLVLPLLACVVDPYEIQMYERILPFFNECGLPRPMAWPQCSATILDARSRKVLERLNLSVDQLYSGEEELAGEIRNAMPRSASEKLENLKSEVARRMDEARSLDLPESEFAKTTDACREKIVYQLQKLLDHCADAQKRQELAANRKIHKLCNFLAPNRHLQERELGGIQIPLRYSVSGLRLLYEKLDIMKLEHQLISMD
jgi:uncharacterized protein YllA (UPF0747 family)